MGRVFACILRQHKIPVSYSACIEDPCNQMKLYYVRNKAEYDALKSEGWHGHYQALQRLLPADEQDFFIPGFSLAANQMVDFKVRFVPGKYPQINWRERVLCPVTRLNNRMRFAAAMIDVLGRGLSSDPMYIMEQTTRLYHHLKTQYPNLIGSEFVDASLESGSVTAEGIQHQDATALSFDDSRFQAVYSFDVLEHIPRYTVALQEVFRALRPQGRFLFTAPFINADQTLIRATLAADGSIEHHREPEYHGDPMSSDGVLCYQHFGWDVLTALKEVGFSDAYAVVGWSLGLGFITPQIMFVAEKA
jgi:hypothetical protein